MPGTHSILVGSSLTLKCLLTVPAPSMVNSSTWHSTSSGMCLLPVSDMIQFFRCCGTITTRRMAAGRMRKAIIMSEWCRYSSSVLIRNRIIGTIKLCRVRTLGVDINVIPHRTLESCLKTPLPSSWRTWRREGVDSTAATSRMSTGRPSARAGLRWWRHCPCIRRCMTNIIMEK